MGGRGRCADEYSLDVCRKRLFAERSEAEILFVDKAFAPVVDEIRPECPKLKTVIYLDDDEAPEGMLAYEDLVDQGAYAMTPCASARTLQGSTIRAARRVSQRGNLPHRALWYNNLVMSKMTEAGPKPLSAHRAHVSSGRRRASGGLTAVGATHVYIPMFDIDGVLDTIEAHGLPIR